GVRKERQRLGEALAVAVGVEERRELLAHDLLLEQRVHHDRRGARVLEPLHGVEVVDQRRRAGHERARQLEAEIRRAEVHRPRSYPATAATGSGSAFAGAAPSGTVSADSCWYTATRCTAARSAIASSLRKRSGSCFSTIRKRVSLRMYSRTDTFGGPESSRSGGSPCCTRRGSKRYSGQMPDSTASRCCSAPCTMS